MYRSLVLFVAALALSVRAAEPDLRLELTRQSLLGTHERYRQYVDGLPVTDGEMNVSPGRTRYDLASGSERRTRLTTNAAGAELVAINWNGAVRFADRIVREERPLQRIAYFYDAETGALLYRQPLYFTAKPARVFDPNPVASLNDPSLRDQNDSAAAVPPQAYRDVTLPDELNGPYARLVDLAPPAVAPPGVAQSFLFNREQDGFEDVNAYFHVDRNQRYLQSLGYSGPRAIAPYAVPIDAHAANGSDNSFFLPSASQAGFGTLYFGEGGTDDAEDADLIVHEYGHALLEWIAPGTFAGTFSSQARAMSEGFGDYWAFSSGYEVRSVSGRDPFCFADWDARCWTDAAAQQCSYPVGSDCLRRLDSTKTMAGYELSDTAGVEHRNGQIWSSALREIHVSLVSRYGFEEGRRVASRIVLEALFGAPPHPTFAAIATRMLEVDGLLHGGINGPLICTVMSARGILSGFPCASVPRGELTHYQSSAGEIAIPENAPEGIISTITIDDPRTIERIGVRVDIQHSARGDLRITLVAPDGREILLQNLSFERTADIHTTYGIDVAPAQPLEALRGLSAAGTWQLRVADQRALDTGRLLSWGLVLQLTGDTPAGERPRPEGPQQTIPVVANVIGSTGRHYVSELRLANSADTQCTATLIFTPSGQNGRVEFAAVDVALAAGQTVTFDDVVQTLFSTVGSGSIEIIGDVLAMSRTYAPSGSGTLGQQVPPRLDTTAFNGPPLLLTGIESDSTFRANVGFTETAGGMGIIRVQRAGGRTTEHTILPFSHLQIPVTANGSVTVSILSGDPRVVAYASVIGPNEDPLFIAGVSFPVTTRDEIAPAISAVGALGRRWTTDLWITSVASSGPLAATFIDPVRKDVVTRPLPPLRAGETRRLDDVVASLFGREAAGAIVLSLPPGVFAAARIATEYSQGVPFLTTEGPAEQHLLFIENSDRYRTNIGITGVGSALAEVIVYDASGAEAERRLLEMENGLAQFPVTAHVVNGRALVRILDGKARAYASFIDNATGDATFIPAQ